MNIDKLETEYLSENQVSELSESEKYYLIVHLMADMESKKHE